MVRGKFENIQYFVNIALRRQHCKVTRKESVMKTKTQKRAMRMILLLQRVFDLILAGGVSVIMARRSVSGGSTLDCLGTRLVPARFWLPPLTKRVHTKFSLPFYLIFRFGSSHFKM